MVTALINITLLTEGGAVLRKSTKTREKLEAVHMKFLVKTTLMTALPRERMMCLPSCV